MDGFSKIPSFDLSRRDALIVGTGAIVYGKIVGDAVKKLIIDERPALHEDMVKETFELAFERAANDRSEDADKRPFRVLEIGMGEYLQTLQRGLYDSAFRNLSNVELKDNCMYSGIEFRGIDAMIPRDESLKKALEKFESSAKYLSPKSFEFVKGDAQRLNFPDGYFDVVTCCLVLCSVNDQREVLSEIRRVLRPNGFFGWVEHVAVKLDIDNGHAILELQQKLFDPLQQAVAHNCHLHRYTDDIILDMFSSTRTDAMVSRFFVEDMWPVSCQVRGVVQR